jgi:hypothetical protein
MSTDERKDQQQNATTEQPTEIKDLAEKPMSKEEQEKVKGGGQYGWYDGSDYG